MNDMLESIRRTEEALKALRSFLESLPPTIAALWDISSPHESVNPMFMQLFPKSSSQRGAMRESATVIAKAWGGQWRAFGREGGWEGVRPEEGPPLGGSKLVLHWVEPALQPGPVITFEDDDADMIAAEARKVMRALKQVGQP